MPFMGSEEWPMRTGVILFAGWLSVTSVYAQQAPRPAPRYGQEARLNDFPQSTPKEALASVLKAIDDGRIAYLLAHLADPDFVDTRVKNANGKTASEKFDEVVRETTTILREEPGSVAELRRFLQNGEWEQADDSAVVRLKDTQGRAVYLRKIGSRWFFENHKKPEAKAK
jgi:hypothetical protein